MDTYSSDPLIRMCAVSTRFSEGVTVGVVNRHKESTEIRLDTDLFKKNIRVYEYDPLNVPENKFGDMQDPVAILTPDNPVYTMKAESIAYFTTDYTEKEKSVYAENVRIENGRLCWDAATDPNHCYWRVYADEMEDFVPSKENQIASTAAEWLNVADEKRHYQVISVDRSGNV